MSITINIKSQNFDRDVVIPIEWKDITVKYWGELATIIKKHYTNATEEDKSKEENKHALLKSPLMQDFNKDVGIQMNETIK